MILNIYDGTYMLTAQQILLDDVKRIFTKVYPTNDGIENEEMIDIPGEQGEPSGH